MVIIIAMSFGLSVQAAYTVENLGDPKVYNDFVVGPGKLQAELKPGSTGVFNITLTNRLGTEKTFQIETEDFVGSRDPKRVVILLDGQQGPYSLKDYLSVESKTFKLGHGERATIPVTIRIPTDAQPGGLYGSVVISTVTTPTQNEPSGQNSVGTNPLITRIGTLVFVKVPGDIKEDGTLKDFSLKNNRKVLSSGPVDFQLLYENNGSIHENPYGFITVNNILGSQVAHIEVEPWFAMPESLRLREVSWDSPFLFGRYVATAEINRGYDNIIDTKVISFWVIPWTILGIVFAGLVIIIALIRWVASKFSITVKK